MDTIKHRDEDSVMGNGCEDSGTPKKRGDLGGSQGGTDREGHYKGGIGTWKEDIEQITSEQYVCMYKLYLMTVNTWLPSNLPQGRLVSKC